MSGKASPSYLGSAVTRAISVWGLLVLASNSTKLSAADLDRAMADGAASVRAELRIVQRIGLPFDFPVAPGFPEGNYLKLAVAIRVP